MASSKWSESILEKWNSAILEEQLDKVLEIYRKWSVLCIALLAGGCAMMLSTENSKVVLFGLFILLTGMVNFAVVRLWMHIKLSMLRMVWELQKRDVSPFHSQNSPEPRS